MKQKKDTKNGKVSSVDSHAPSERPSSASSSIQSPVHLRTTAALPNQVASPNKKVLKAPPTDQSTVGSPVEDKSTLKMFKESPASTEVQWPFNASIADRTDQFANRYFTTNSIPAQLNLFSTHQTSYQQNAQSQVPNSLYHYPYHQYDYYAVNGYCRYSASSQNGSFGHPLQNGTSDFPQTSSFDNDHHLNALHAPGRQFIGLS